MSMLALVIDDSMLIRHTVCRFLESRGFKVETAANGIAALEALSYPAGSDPYRPANAQAQRLSAD